MAPQPPPQYTYIIAGGGCAGLSLAAELAANIEHTDPNATILLVEKERGKYDDRTWCFWSTGNTPWEHLSAHQWGNIALYHRNARLTRPLAPYRYHLLRSEDFYAHANKILKLSPRVHTLYGTIEASGETPDAAWVTVNGTRHTGSWLFDSTFTPQEFVQSLDKSKLLLQHFLGIEIETTEECFNPDTLHLFDFRGTDSTQMQFIYLLPFSKTRALVECTEFSAKPYERDYYRERINYYLQTYYSVAKYRLVHEEFGIIPMYGGSIPRRAGARIMNIGTKGGRAKGSTGYAFARIHADSRAITASLRRHAHPFAVPATPRRYLTTDCMLIDVIARHPESAQELFFNMFKRNPIKRIFKLLDEKISLHQLLLFMLTMPVVRFMCAYFRVKRKSPPPPPQ